MVTAEVQTPYDTKTHITAGELRQLGFLIPETLSDDAYVRRVAVGLNGHERLGRKTCTLRLAVLEQFVDPNSFSGLTFLGSLS
jgi:hypothetical protein